jgi:hypothetical protein
MFFQGIKTRFVVRSLAAGSLFLGLAGISYGDSHMSGMGPTASREEQIAYHEKMIGAHTKMIECLKTDKPVKDCHEVMMQTCAKIHDGECPMMQGMMGDGPGMRGTKGKGMMNHGKGKMMNQKGASGNTPPAANEPATTPKK